MLEHIFAQLSSSPSPSVLPFRIYRQDEFCAQVGGGSWCPLGVLCVCVHAHIALGSLVELELLFRGEVVAGLVQGR